MTKEERLFALMRRFVGVEKCLELLTRKERDLILAFFRRVPLAEMAKARKSTKEMTRQRVVRICRILADALFDEEETT